MTATFSREVKDLDTKLNLTLVKGVLVGALGGLLFGFDTAVIAGSLRSLRTLFVLSPLRVGLTVSIALVGTVIGSMLSGPLGERLGGRESLRIFAACYLVSALGCALAPNWVALLLFRFIAGLAIGGSSVLGPVYIAELSPAKWRGRMVGAFQINIVLGVLAAYLSNYLIGLAVSGVGEWRWQLGVATVPAALFLFMLFGIPRSARWLVTKGRIEEARQVLGQLGSEDPRAELAEIVESIHPERSTQVERLFQWKYRYPIFLAMALAVFNQMTGINAIIYYLNDIFSMADFSKTSSDLQAVAIGLTNLLATLLAMTMIDRIGRKTLLLVGSVGMVICLAGVSVVFLTHQHPRSLLPLLVGYIFSFGISQGAVIWVFISEVFPNRVRAKGQSLGSSTHWVMNAIIAALFPLVATGSPAYPFIFFGLMVLLQFFVVLWVFPETKGTTLEGMGRKLGIES
jgi:SP family arabinose:H+ symporter-like MFS transporter